MHTFNGETFEVNDAVKGDPNYEMQQLHKIANGIGGEVWHSGGGIFGVLVQRDGWEIFFGFADDVLGWDINRMPEKDYFCGSGTTELTIDQTALVIERCQEVLDTKEIQSI